MKNKICVTSYVNDAFIVKEAHINFGIKKSFYVKIPVTEKVAVTRLSDPWINILLFKMMETGGDFYVEGSISQSLVHNAEMFSLIWNKWCPDKYKPIHIIPQHVSIDNVRVKNNKLITAFSGGLDAAYTAYKYKNNLQNGKRYDFDTCVMIHGADIPIQDKEQFHDAFISAKRMTDDLKLKLIPVSTNYRSYDCSWGYEFGAVISGILSFFSKKFAFGAATDASVDNFFVPWGMNLISDRFLSSDNFHFISDGIEHNRIERLNVIKNWPVCLNNLRVCWENEDKSKNCGKCEKCVRTKLEFLALGVDYLPTMPNQFKISDFKNIKHNDHMRFFSEIYRYAIKHHSLPEKVLQSLRHYIKLQHKHHGFLWHIMHMKF